MSLFSAPGLDRLRAEPRSIQFTFAVTVAAPVSVLALVWGLIATSLPGGAGGVLLALLGSLLVAGAAVGLMRWFARGLSRDVQAMETAARRVAEEQFPPPGEQPWRGEPTRAAAGAALSHPFTVETGRAGAALLALLERAETTTAVEARMRDGIRKVFVSLARRNQSLLQRQLRLIDTLEQKASDPATLADLFRLDHLTTRMRRHAENLIILSGAAPGRSWSDPVPVIDVIRGAVAEVEDYTRVAVMTRSEEAVAGAAAADVIHLLAELIENGTFFSPSEMRVEIRADRVTNGFAIEVDDRGLGVKASQLGKLNEQLANPPDFDLANADQLGLFVVGRLAARHGVQVSLRPSPYGGVTAVVLLPASLIVPVTSSEGGASYHPGPAIGPGAEPAAGESLALTGPRRVLAAVPERPAPAPPAPAVAPATASAGADAGEEAAGTHRGLPRRVRQANLSPHLRDGAGASARAESPGTAEAGGGRSPEATRNLVASLQRGWQRGRQEDLPDMTAARPAEAVDPWAATPRSEET